MRDALLNSGTTLSFAAGETSTISGAVTGDGGIYLNAGGFGTQSLTHPFGRQYLHGCHHGHSWDTKNQQSETHNHQSEIQNPHSEILLIPAPPKQSARDMRTLGRDLILQVWGGDPLQCPCCKGTMKPVRKVIRREEIQFFLRLHGLWEGIVTLPRLPAKKCSRCQKNLARRPGKLCSRQVETAMKSPYTAHSRRGPGLFLTETPPTASPTCPSKLRRRRKHLFHPQHLFHPLFPATPFPPPPVRPPALSTAFTQKAKS